MEIVPVPPKEVVFESVNLLHEKDKKAALDELDTVGFTQKEFSSSTTTNKKTESNPEKIPEAKPFPVDSLLHPGVCNELVCL